MFHDVQTYLNERIDEVLAGSSEPIVVRIFGSDLDLLHRKADEVRERSRRSTASSTAYVEFQEGVPQMEVKVDLATAQRYGLKPGDVRRAAATMVESEEVGDIFAGGRAYDVNVWSTPETRNSLTSMSELLIDTPAAVTCSWGTCPRADRADAERRSTAKRPRGASTSSRRATGATSARSPAMSRRRLRHRLPARSTTPRCSASTRSGRRPRSACCSSAIGAAIGVFLLLQASFGSFRLATLSFVTLPSALVGGVLAAWLGGGVLSLGSLVGFFTVLGIAARNGIMMINHFQHLEQYEGETFGPGLVLRGAHERLSPILMTALTRAGARAPGRCRRRSRPRDRAPDGGRRLSAAS